MLATLKATRVVPVCSVDTVDIGLHMAESLIAGNLPVAEITFRTAAAEATIAAIARRFPAMLIGAGTILNVADLDRAIAAGATFAVAPGCNPTVVRAALERNFPFFPGVATPSDIERALELGVRTLKFFPAEAIGGVTLLKALIAPYSHTGVHFVPTGGIKASNMGDYLALPEVLAIGGSWMVDGKLLKAGAWNEVRDLAAAAVRAATGKAGTPA